MGGEIFISYRREESGWVAGRLRDRLQRDFDPEKIFMDIDAKAIPLGANFKQVIERKVCDCDVLIAVIGKNWLSTTDDNGGRRLHNPEDFVRLEIGTALKREICVIPVLVDGMRMPRSMDLPEDLRSLIWLNALSVTAGTYFDGDCQRLAAAISEVLEQLAAKEQERSAAEQRQREEQERLAAEQRQREEQERLATEQREREEQERLAAMKRKEEQPAAELQDKKLLEADRRWREEVRQREQQEKQRLAAERREKERLAAERREKQRLEAEQRDKERVEAELREKERLEAEARQKKEKERLDAEQRETERPDAELREKERLEAEQREKERVEALRQEKERQSRSTAHSEEQSDNIYAYDFFRLISKYHFIFPVCGALGFIFAGSVTGAKFYWDLCGLIPNIYGLFHHLFKGRWTITEAIAYWIGIGVAIAGEVVLIERSTWEYFAFLSTDNFPIVVAFGVQLLCASIATIGVIRLRQLRKLGF